MPPLCYNNDDDVVVLLQNNMAHVEGRAAAGHRRLRRLDSRIRSRRQRLRGSDGLKCKILLVEMIAWKVLRRRIQHDTFERTRVVNIARQTGSDWKL